MLVILFLPHPFPYLPQAIKMASFGSIFTGVFIPISDQKARDLERLPKQNCYCLRTKQVLLDLYRGSFRGSSDEGQDSDNRP